MTRLRTTIGLAVVAVVASLGLPGCQGMWNGSSDKVVLWNGKDLSGWTKVVSDPTVDVNDIWQVRGKAIYCSGAVNGYIRTDQAYSNYHLHVEWRWPEDPANSGVLLHIGGPDQVWPSCIESQLKASNAGDIVLMNGTGLTVDGTDRQDSNRQFVMIVKKNPTSEKSAGRWNSYDIYCEGDSLACYVNGELQNEGTDASPSFGYIGLQSEGGPIEFRNVYLVRLEPS